MSISTGTYYPQLDGLRAFGVLGVLFYHTYDIRPVKENTLSAAYDLVVKLRDLPIYLFFILSGYLITRILLSMRGQPQRYTRFYLARLLRILPLYYIVLILLYLLFPGVMGRSAIPFGEQLFYWIPIANSAMALHHPVTGPEHFWTLCIEIQFYLLIPLLLFNVSRIQATRILFAGLLVSFLAKVAFIALHYNPYYATLCRMDIVILGCLAALLPWPENKKQYLAGYAGFAGILIIYLAFFRNGSTDWAFRLTLLSLGCLAMLIYCLQDNGWLNHFLGNPVFRQIAKAGYSTYVFHPFCIYGYYQYFGQHHYAIDLAACFILALAAGHAGYFLIEYPVNGLRRHLQNTYLHQH